MGSSVGECVGTARVEHPKHATRGSGSIRSLTTHLVGTAKLIIMVTRSGLATTMGFTW
jgi:hypothetical protein